MKLQVRVQITYSRMPELIELFPGVRFYTPGFTIDSGQPSIHAEYIQFEIDGADELTEQQYVYLMQHVTRLSFVKPSHTFTEEEIQMLDVAGEEVAEDER